MAYQKGQLISEGKTKRIWETNSDRHVIAEFYDDPTMYHAKKKQYFDGKGILCNKINALFMKLLEQNGINTHFVETFSDNSTVIRKAKMIPVEVVVRNYSAGSMSRRLGIPERTKLKSPVLEFCYKNDQLDDPVINEYHAYAMQLCTQEEMNVMCYQATRINKLLCDIMDQIGFVVADFKLEFGRIRNWVVIADEITPNVARFWDKNNLHRVDNDGKNPELEYQIILERLEKLIK
ncbi:MAG: phosphoribosylaminoimidazolesuccinocarboxamide synthase [Clostridia bacterium]|nr:phosphoribosylaminoimidazolesuccinocarboxamide synthase [Clostridia bacterium]